MCHGLFPCLSVVQTTASNEILLEVARYLNTMRLILIFFSLFAVLSGGAVFSRTSTQDIEVRDHALAGSLI